MTERLYYHDSYVTDFDANILRVVSHDGRPAVVLDRTAFYPTSGGQPCDTGTLGTAKVVDVVDGDDGAIVHVIEGELAPGTVHGAIDWSRRFEHMQQHTGQHVLSAAFERMASARTESFHLGSNSSTIDLSRTLSSVDLERAETEANRVIWEDRPVNVRFASAEEAASLPLRKDSDRTGTLRLIEVPDFDLSACGGTHVARTGAIGAIVVASSERFRGGTRVEFLCGVRAVRGYRELRDTVAASVKLVSVLPGELPAAIERLQADSKDSKRQLKDLRTRLAAFESAALVDRAETLGAVSGESGGVRAVIAAIDGFDPAALKELAVAIASRSGHVAALFNSVAPLAVVVARASDAPVDCASVLKRLIARFGGKGGGRPELAQGGGLHATVDEVTTFTREAIQM